MIWAFAACVPHYPGPAAPAERGRWPQSEAATPKRHDRSDGALFQEQAATPTAALDLYARAEKHPHIGPVKHGALVCHVRSAEPRKPLGPTPDLIVELDLDGRQTRLGFTDRTQFDFSVGLVDLAVGHKVRARVLEDTLDGGVELLNGEVRYNGSSPWGWTTRVEDRRTSMRCRVPSEEVLVRTIDDRMSTAWRAVRKSPRKGEQAATDAVRELAALVGWQDPRVQDLRARIRRSY